MHPTDSPPARCLGRALGAACFGLAACGPDSGDGPPIPDMGSLHRVMADGTLAPIVDGLDRPTSFQLLRGDAYVVTLDGEVWRVEVGFQP